MTAIYVFLRDGNEKKMAIEGICDVKELADMIQHTIAGGSKSIAINIPGRSIIVPTSNIAAIDIY